jgi:hypothetical protein
MAKKQPEDKPKQKKEDIGAEILKEKRHFEELTAKQRKNWEDLYDLYNGVLPASKHKSLSRNFVPKVHQAVETMASFLVGNNPSLFVTPVGVDDDDKARFMQRLLEFQWEHDLNMKPKVLVWVKSAILFGVGVMKVGWDTKKDGPFAYPLNIGDFYTDPFERDLQNATRVIERLVLPIEHVEKMYDVKGLKPVGITGQGERDSSMFDNTDFDTVDREVIQKIELLERWTPEEVVTVAVQYGTKDDKPAEVPKVLRRIKNPYGFVPYVSVHYKDSPLPNRFYTIGAIEPVAKTQKRMNQLVNQIVDNVNLILSPAAKVRRGSGIDPRQMQLFPGKTLFMNNIQQDLDFVVVPDTTSTGFRLLQYLDGEFQRGTSVTDIRQGIDSPDTATGARIQQANLNTTTTLVKENVEHAVGIVGQLLAKLNIKNISSMRAIRIFDPEEVFDFERQTGVRPEDPFNGLPLEPGPEERADIQRNGRVFRIDKGDLDGDYDIAVRADSTLLQSKDVLRKQLLDFVTFLSSIGVKPDVQKLADIWGQLSGIPNAHALIERQPEVPLTAPQVGPGGGQGIPGVSPTETSAGLTPQGIENQVAVPPVSPFIQ